MPPQAEVGGLTRSLNLKAVKDVAESGLVNGKWFGEDISKLIPRGDKANLNFLLRNPVTNKMIIYLNMLSKSMKDRIRREISRTKIITPNSRSRDGGNL